MGQVAALATSVLWSFTSILFTLAGRRVGTMIINRTRLIFAVILLIIAHTVLQGEPIPFHASGERWFWLAISGVLGLVIGDSLLFQALVLIGPRLSMLMMASAPIISTLLAWLFLGEVLEPLDLLAIAITVAGIAWVVLEVHPEAKSVEGKARLLGILYGLGGATGQALGLITAKRGLEGEFPALSAVVMRMLAALGTIWLLAILQGRARVTIAAWKDHQALRLIFGASVVGPFLGVWFSLISIDLAPVGIASTLMALSPIFLIPLTHWIFKERISLRAVVGTLVALVGVAMILVDG
jgi:drug/metabolite transporter (DMT)-like permease